MPFGERWGSISPRASYIRSVWGCISANSAATEIMNTPRSVETSMRAARGDATRSGGHQALPPAEAPALAPAFANRSARGSPFITSDSRSTAASCSGESVVGTSITNR